AKRSAATAAHCHCQGWSTKAARRWTATPETEHRCVDRNTPHQVTEHSPAGPYRRRDPPGEADADESEVDEHTGSAGSGRAAHRHCHRDGTTPVGHERLPLLTDRQSRSDAGGSQIGRASCRERGYNPVRTVTRTNTR